MKYAEFACLYVVFGFALYLGCKGWYNFLVALAGRHDRATRRRIASACYLLIVMPLVLIGLGATFLGGIVLIHPRMGPSMLPIALAMACAVLPGANWWFRRWKSLVELGYGRQSQRG